ncbi:hypothetical protein CsSME_00032291 [Camellia sinensis var. sinensis]
MRRKKPSLPMPPPYPPSYPTLHNCEHRAWLNQTKPKTAIISIQRRDETGQRISKWSTNSAALQHIQHQFTKICPRRIKLSMVKTPPKLAVQTKKAAFEGEPDNQTPLHG